MSNRSLVCLTFDFDVLSPWIYREQISPTALSRGEFGLVGARRILSLLERHNILSTWFTPGHTIESFPDICREVHRAGHEIGHHGYLHEPPGALSYEEEDAVLLKGNRAIEALTGGNARGYRSPAWDLSPNTVDLLLKHGIRYDSSMMAHDSQPYRARQGDVIDRDGPARFGSPSRLIEMPISWSLDDYPHFEFVRGPSTLLQGLRRAEDVLANWVDDFRYMAENDEWGVLTYTFHPQVIGRGHRMLLLDQLIDMLGSRGATFVRMEDAIAEYEARSPWSE